MTWQKIKLGELCTVTSSKRFHLSERVTDGIPFYCSKEIIMKNNGEKITECDYIPEDVYEAIAKKYGVPQCGDVLLTTRGSIGVPYRYREDDHFYFADGNLTWLKDFSDKVLSPFLYYWFKSHDGFEGLNSIAKGTAQKAVSIIGIKNLEIPLPPLAVQRRIADILSAYDDLIENNRKQIKLLEEAAQRLYKEWFIDLRFPGHEHTPIINGIPDGWEEKTLGDIIDFEIGGGWGSDTPTNEEDAPGYVIRGTDINGITRGSVSTIPFRYHAKSNIASRILKHGDIIFEVSGGSRNEGVGKAILMTEPLLSYFNAPVICASFCKLMRLEKPELAHYLYESIRFWRSCGRIGEFEKKSASCIINYRWKDFLDQQSVRIPPDAVMSQYNDLIVPIYDKIINLSLGIEKNALMRDRLLPKLMFGEIEPLVKNCR